MVNLFDEDYIGNPKNKHYVWGSRYVSMDWREFKKMYKGLHKEVRKEFDKYLFRLESINLSSKLVNLIKMEEESQETTRPLLIKFNNAA